MGPGSALRSLSFGRAKRGPEGGLAGMTVRECDSAQRQMTRAGAALDGGGDQLADLLRYELQIGKLVAAAIERGARARHLTLS